MTPRQHWTLLATILGFGSGVSRFGHDDRPARPAEAAEASATATATAG